MAITGAYRAYDRSAQGARGGKFSYRRVYHLESNSPDEDEATVLAYLIAELPPQYPGDPNAWMAELKVEPLDVKQGGAYYWKAEATWDIPELGSAQGNTNPLLRPWRISGNTDQVEREFRVDLDEKPVATTAGEFFSDPIPTILRSRFAFSITQNFPDLPGPSEVGLVDRCNADSFLGFGPGELLCLGLSFEPAQEWGIDYYAYTYRFAHREEGWEFYKRYNQGTLILSADGLSRVLDSEGNPLPFPVNITEEGDAYLDEEGQPVEAVELEFRAYEKTSFSAIAWRPS